MLSNKFIIRNLEGDRARENFLVAAVISVIVIRTFLALTDYPQVGGGNFHIAHMIWGGFLMMGAILILISFLNKSATNTAAIIGGIGFGTFIDELGKFITKDNDYFFEPTIAIIYVIFVLIYLVARFIPKYKSVSRKEYLVNALELTKEAIINDLDTNEKKKALSYLKRSPATDPTTIVLRHLLREIDTIPQPPKSPIIKAREFARKLYLRLIRSQILVNIIVIALIIQAGTTIFTTTQLLILKPELSFSEWGRILSALLAVLFVIIGVISFAKSKIAAYKYFKLAVLVSIFLTQFFVFFEAQLSALFNLILSILTLLTINYAIFEEEEERNRSLKPTILESVE